eukprot:TRINITY_DN18030_c0_g1_i1.p1 TRINITY_DN18030_c0_g1~~TRINITY_DN18030_c0_g1_i1.p1  ORF type:complete len:129 (+),score=5.93 TRINITY_DN18030_c0_g1_i1:63-449(+)
MCIRDRKFSVVTCKFKPCFDIPRKNVGCKSCVFVGLDWLLADEAVLEDSLLEKLLIVCDGFTSCEARLCLWGLLPRRVDSWVQLFDCSHYLIDAYSNVDATVRHFLREASKETIEILVVDDSTHRSCL